jgi:hypothetical protein
LPQDVEGAQGAAAAQGQRSVGDDGEEAGHAGSLVSYSIPG